MLRLSFEFWICNLTLTMALVYLFLPCLKNCCILNETWSQKYEMLWQSRKVELHSFFPKWFYDQIYVSQMIYNHITLRNLYILSYQFKVWIGFESSSWIRLSWYTCIIKVLTLTKTTDPCNIYLKGL